MILAPGETLGSYRVLEVVSIGGMAIVYRAEQFYLGREVALKVIAPRVAGDDAFRKRFRSEGRAAAKLDHPNIVPVHDSGEDNGRLFIVMRFIRGQTLAEQMRADRLTAEKTISLLVPIADALDTAHAAEIVHRDVKPQNIIVSTDTGHPYLADFGIAKGVATTGFTETRGFIGTFNYAAPEQILGRPVTPATDIYALTAVLYHCLTGQPAYPYETDAGVLHAHVYEPPPTVAADHPGASSLNALTARGMAKEPGARFASASELMREASGLVDTWTRNGDQLHRRGLARQTNHGGTAPANSTNVATSAPDRPRRVRRGHRLMLGIGAVTALLVAGVVAEVLRSSRSTLASPPLTASSAPFTIVYKRPWRPVSGPVFGRFALSARPQTDRGRSLRLAFGYATFTAGQLATSSPIPGGVPPALVDRSGRRYKAADAVVAGHVGRKYTWSMPGGSLVAYVIPLRDGDAAAICRAPRVAATALRSCGLLVRNAHLSGVEVVSPGPDGQLAHTVNAALKPVAAARSSLRWPRGTKLEARASQAAHVAGIESDASAALAGLTPPPRYAREVARIGVAVKDEAAGLSALTKAASANSRAAYSRESRRVSVASRRLNTATQAFARFELGIPTLPILHLAAPPPVPVSHTTTPAPSTSTQTSTTPTTSTSTQTTTTPPETTFTSPPITSPPPETSTTPQQSTTSSSTTAPPAGKTKQLHFS